MKPLHLRGMAPSPQAEAATGSSGARGPAGASARKATLLCVAMLTIMSGATISPALPGIEAQFSGTEGAALKTRLVLTLPGLFVALCAPFAGRFADLYGRKGLLIGSIVLFVLAGISGLVLNTLTGLLVGRALLGVAVAGIMTTGTTLVGDYFSGAERDRYMGLQMTFVGLGGLVFLTGGGLLADAHWRAPFAIYGLGLALLPAVILFIQEPQRATQQPLATAPAQGDGGGKLAIALLFAIAIINSLTFYLFPTQLPFYLNALHLGAASEAGLALGLFTLSSSISSLAYSRLRMRSGVAGIFGIGFGLMAAGLWLTAMAASYAAVLVATATAGIGLGLVIPNLMTGTLMLAPVAIRGRVAGGLTASIFIGQFASPFVSQPWIASFGFAAAFRDAGLLLALIAVLSIWMARKRKA